MESIIAFIKIINPIEWLKELHKMPICLKFFLFIACLVFLFLPNNINGINLNIIKHLSLYLLPIIIVSFLGKIFQDRLDKSNLQKAQKEEAKRVEIKSKEKLEEYFRQFDLCSREEKEILEKFYCNQTTTIDISFFKVDTARIMNSKGLSFISSSSTNGEGRAYIAANGLKLINAYFDKDKEMFFAFLQTIQGRKFKLLKEFDYYNDNELFPDKGYKTTAQKLVNDFIDNKFDNIYWNSIDEKLVISEVYLEYIKQYFSETN